MTVFFKGLPNNPFFFGVIVTLQVPLVLSLMAQVALPLVILQVPFAVVGLDARLVLVSVAVIR